MALLKPEVFWFLFLTLDSNTFYYHFKECNLYLCFISAPQFMWNSVDKTGYFCPCIATNWDVFNITNKKQIWPTFLETCSIIWERWGTAPCILNCGTSQGWAVDTEIPVEWMHIASRIKVSVTTIILLFFTFLKLIMSRNMFWSYGITSFGWQNCFDLQWECPHLNH
jgi:hypothetical protein